MSATFPRGIFEEDLPSSLREICELIDLPATIELAKKFGGQSIVLPSKMHKAWTMPAVIGHEAARKLLQLRGGSRLYVPKLDEALRVHRNLQIVDLYTDGKKTVRELAAEFHLSDRQIWRILGTPEPDRDTNQLALF